MIFRRQNLLLDIVGLLRRTARGRVGMGWLPKDMALWSQAMID